MENASKALLIAGAILIVIILIGIGVAVINSTSNLQDQAGSSADSMAAQTFNAQFTAYEGSGKSASQVTSLISAIKASNGTSGRTVYINGNADENGKYSADGDAPEISAGTKYTISFAYDGDGYICNAGIDDE